MSLDPRKQPTKDVAFVRDILTSCLVRPTSMVAEPSQSIGAGGTGFREQARLAYFGGVRSLEAPTERPRINFQERYLRIEQARTHGFIGLSL